MNILCLPYYTNLFISLCRLKSKTTKLHRGQVLATVVETTGLNKAEVAKKAGYSRASYYKHKLEPNLEFHILIAYGKAIKHDFTEEFPEMPKYLLEDPFELYGKPPTLEEAIKQRDYWKDKYLELLEKYNKIIEERIK